ncbi:DUF3006 domain-containing protein [Halalkalibacter okhensis]|uniref:DUF3006 domain-containing protein n=1 Tax=Halalkalibacter okhensis TaxID=333138 RepID=A0A0B0IFL7_9BACI|nr:DUF3006 domain-containing protein [Halalkalibacter okhensis]KHF38844.1 hypothetical protein LQ50_18630 [Halalkalibacter okhensis]
MVKGVLDRIVDQHKAVILVESLGKEFVIDTAQLPLTSIEGTWFIIKMEGNTIKSIDIDHEQTSNAKQSIAEKMQKLRGNKKSSRFKRGER